MSELLITREIDYALRMLFALAKGQQMTAGAICRQEFTPQQFGYKILKKLEKGGLIKITRGADGGCQLCCDLKKITLYDLMQIMGQDNAVSACMKPEFQCNRRRQNKNYCTIYQNLAKFQQKFDSELKACSLYEILESNSNTEVIHD